MEKDAALVRSVKHLKLTFSILFIDQFTFWLYAAKRVLTNTVLISGNDKGCSTTSLGLASLICKIGWACLS